MPHNKNINHNEDYDKMQKPDAIKVLNNITESHSIKDLTLEKHYYGELLENVSKVRRKGNETEDNSDGTYKIANFL